MKTNKCKIVFIAFLILVCIPILLFRFYAFTFSNFIVDENAITVFYPKGVADRYKGITVVSPNEDHRIWKYNLNKEEIKNIDNDISIGVWKTISKEELKYINEVYFGGFLFDYTELDKMYYFLYDLNSEDYKAINISDTLLFGQNNLLFLYNKTTSEYYCVSKIVH